MRQPNEIYRDAIETHALDEMCGGKAKFIVVKPKHAKRFFTNLATLVAMCEKELKAKGYTIIDRPPSSLVNSRVPSTMPM